MAMAGYWTMKKQVGAVNIDFWKCHYRDICVCLLFCFSCSSSIGVEEMNNGDFVAERMTR